MIAKDFDYYCPETLEEAVILMDDLSEKSKSAHYYAGGTEVVTYARKGRITPDAVVDIKAIPQCKEQGESENELVFGAALSLNDIVEKNLFPLLTESVRKIADHTVRNRLTLGGNICGRLPYRESLLPFLVSNAKVVIMSRESGITECPLSEVFDRRMKLDQGELLLQLKVPKDAADCDSISVRKVKQGEVDYPLVHVAALKDSQTNSIKMAFSNACPFSFRSDEIDNIVSNSSVDLPTRVNDVLANLPTKVTEDLKSSREYREFILKSAITEIISYLEGVAK